MFADDFEDDEVHMLGEEAIGAGQHIFKLLNLKIIKIMKNSLVKWLGAGER